MDDWKPIETAPHDRTWFLARTAWGAMRFVHFADDCDRYPISHDGECWPTPPIEWCAVNIPDLVAALRRVTAERDAYKDAHEKEQVVVAQCANGWKSDLEASRAALNGGKTDD